MTQVKTIKIIKQGTTAIEAFENPRPASIALKGLCGIGGGSTVTFIESDIKILVDTGFDFENNSSEENARKNKKALVHALKNFGLKPGDIDLVFITHWHQDHFGNLKLFKNSEVLMSETAIERHNLDFKGIKDGEKIADGVKVVFTPGHTPDHASLFLETDPMRYSEITGSGGRITGIGESKIVVAGDAIVSSSYYTMNKVWKYNADFYSEEAALNSIDKIRDFADYIIPGHGGMFMNERKLKSLKYHQAKMQILPDTLRQSHPIFP